MKKLKVMAACGSGMGSSQIIKMKLERVFRKLNLGAEVVHKNVDEARAIANDYDVIFCSDALTGKFSNTTATVIGLKNLLSEVEMIEKIKAKGLLAG